MQTLPIDNDKMNLITVTPLTYNAKPEKLDEEVIKLLSLADLLLRSGVRRFDDIICLSQSVSFANTAHILSIAIENCAEMDRDGFIQNHMRTKAKYNYNIFGKGGIDKKLIEQVMHMDNVVLCVVPGSALYHSSLRDKNYKPEDITPIMGALYTGKTWSDITRKSGKKTIHSFEFNSDIANFSSPEVSRRAGMIGRTEKKNIEDFRRAMDWIANNRPETDWNLKKL